LSRRKCSKRDLHLSLLKLSTIFSLFVLLFFALLPSLCVASGASNFLSCFEFRKTGLFIELQILIWILLVDKRCWHSREKRNKFIRTRIRWWGWYWRQSDVIARKWNAGYNDRFLSCWSSRCFMGYNPRYEKNTRGTGRNAARLL